MPGFTLAEVADLLMLITHGDEAEPQVLAALHMVSGCGSSHTYLLFACATSPVRRTMQVDKSNALQVLNRRVTLIAIARSVARFLFHSMMLFSFQAFWLSSNCNSPSLLTMSCAAGKRTPLLLLLSVSFKMI